MFVLSGKAPLLVAMALKKITFLRLPLVLQYQHLKFNFFCLTKWQNRVMVQNAPPPPSHYN